MRVWLLRASELMPVVDGNDRLLRMGMLAEELSKRNHSITWFASSFNHFKKKQYSKTDVVVKVKENYNLNLIHANQYKKNISLARILNHYIIAFKLKRKMKKIEKPDIIFASFPTVEFAYEAVKYGKKNNIPVIIDVRDLWPDIFKHNLKGIVKILSIPYVKYLNIKTKKIMRDCYAITSISPKMLDWGLAKGKREKTVKDKYFYIGYQKSELMNSLKKDLIDKEKFNICFFATINNQFNYDIIIKLANKLKNDDVLINICGTGPNLNKFKNKVLENNLDNIKFLGWQEKENLNYILNNSQIGFAPYKDTFDFRMSVSNKFSEYLSYGLPVLMTSTGYMKELIDEYQVGCASVDVNELYKFIMDMKNNPLKREVKSLNAIKLFKEKFDASKIYIELANYLEKLEKEYTK